MFREELYTGWKTSVAAIDRQIATLVRIGKKFYLRYPSDSKRLSASPGTDSTDRRIRVECLHTIVQLQGLAGPSSPLSNGFIEFSVLNGDSKT